MVKPAEEDVDEKHDGEENSKGDGDVGEPGGVGPSPTSRPAHGGSDGGGGVRRGHKHRGGRRHRVLGCKGYMDAPYVNESYLTERLEALGVCPCVKPPTDRLGARTGADFHVTLEERSVGGGHLEHGKNGGHSDASGVVVGELRYEVLCPTGPGARWSFRYQYGNKWALPASCKWLRWT